MKPFISVLPLGNREGADGKVRMDVSEWGLWGKKLAPSGKGVHSLSETWTSAT